MLLGLGTGFKHALNLKYNHPDLMAPGEQTNISPKFAKALLSEKMMFLLLRICDCSLESKDCRIKLVIFAHPSACCE